MKTLKIFVGIKPPLLKKGEVATNCCSIFVRDQRGAIKRFASVKHIKWLIKEEIAKQLLENES